MRTHLFVFALALLLLPFSVSARVTPEDIVNAQKETYNQRMSRYSEQNKQKLSKLTDAIANTNKEETDKLSEIMERQGQVLDEYLRRKGIELPPETDGIHRRDNPNENALYWLTYAHEAVAYQAAKIYVINLTSESNVNSDIKSTINNLQADMRGLNGKVLKSQQIIQTLVTK